MLIFTDHGYLDENIQRDCLSYNSYDETISSIPCENKQYGICICSSCNKSNTYDLENDKMFMELLQNMTVDSKRTSRNRRKKGSAEDTRQSSKALGVFSALFLCAIVLLIVSADLSKLKTRKTS
jgi:anaerobic C4-dicarboxylate transporter